MSQDMPNLPEPWGSIAQGALLLIGGGGGLKIIERIFASRDKRVDVALAISKRQDEDIDKLRKRVDDRDDEVEGIRREMYQGLAHIAELTAEGHLLRAEGHRLRNWVTGFYLDIQNRWKRAGLPMDDLPTLPDWVKDSPDGPTASHRDAPPTERKP